MLELNAADTKIEIFFFFILHSLTHYIYLLYMDVHGVICCIENEREREIMSQLTLRV